MEKEAIAVLKREGVAQKEIIIEKSLDMRYYGQLREQNAQMPAGPVTRDTLQITLDRFHEKHRKIIGYSDNTYPTEIVRLHLTGISRVIPPQVPKIPQGDMDVSRAVKSTRKAFFRDFRDYVEVKVYDGEKLLAGNVMPGPCIIEERMTTLVVPPNMKMKVDDYGNYVKVEEE
jgi:N-methylhydantoinase A/oxoprolinase/acetone carboxylase beta subunit